VPVLLKHLADLTAGARAHPSASPTRTADFEAPTDARDYILNMITPKEFGPNEARNVVRGPEISFNLRIARDRNGKLGRVPDAWSLAMNDSGKPLPDFGLDPKILANVVQYQVIRDKPPSGDDDTLVRSGIPAFVIGARDRDIWEIGKVSGAISVRLISVTQLGPWEPFQQDPSKYRYYGEHILNGHTAEQDFADPKVAALTRAACGDKAAIATALQNGADPNGKGVDGDTPLFWAVDCGNANGTEALLKAGADPNYRQPAVQPQLLGNVSPSANSALDQYSATYEAAVATRNLAILKLLLKYGGDPNAFDDNPYDETALTMSWNIGNYLEGYKHDAHAWDEYYALLDVDKDINRLQPDGQTLAMTEARSGQFDKVQELLQHGYSYELNALSAVVQNWGKCEGCVVLQEKAAARERLMEILKAKGVVFPIPAQQ
jgi:hypothetical protein